MDLPSSHLECQKIKNEYFMKWKIGTDLHTNHEQLATSKHFLHSSIVHLGPLPSSQKWYGLYLMAYASEQKIIRIRNDKQWRLYVLLSIGYHFSHSPQMKIHWKSLILQLIWKIMYLVYKLVSVFRDFCWQLLPFNYNFHRIAILFWSSYQR